MTVPFLRLSVLNGNNERCWWRKVKVRECVLPWTGWAGVKFNEFVPMAD